VQDINPADWLRRQYLQRRQKNPAYSLRAFGRHAGIPHSRISEIFAGKRPLTARMLTRATDYLGVDPESRRLLLQQAQGARRGGPAPVVDSYREVDEFRSVSEWYHTAILSLIETKKFRSEPVWIARRLGITTAEVNDALERLQRLGLVEVVRGQLKLCESHTTTGNDIPSAAVRASQKQSLEQAIAALEDVAIELRDISAVTMAVDLKKLPAAKQLIRQFRRQLAALLETGQRTEVYNLNIQLVPVTKPEQH
jgi:plasmid maintenance system antidote protein VapI/DNA-binding MarR family transcriptional regulator